MSHVAELALVFADPQVLESVLRLPQFGVRVEKNGRMVATRSSQSLDGNSDTMALIAHLRGGEMLGFRQRPLTAAERTGMVDTSESSAAGPSTGLIPVGDLYYGGVEGTFGKGLCRLQGEYYAEMLRRNADGYATVTVKDVGDKVLVEAEIN